MKSLSRSLLLTLWACTLPFISLSAQSQEATIRKNLAERLPNFPKIDEISKTPMAGLYEVRVNDSELFYTDAEGHFLIQGLLIDTKTKRNLTDERIDKLTAAPFEQLPLKSAFTVVRGNGKRKVAIFEDPNCGYCKKLEQELQKVSDITVHVILIPILGPDSRTKSQNIWCAKDKAKAWTDWVIRNVTPPTVAKCDMAPIDAAVTFSQKHRITGTPALFFADGTRVPGAVSAAQVEKILNAQ